MQKRRLGTTGFDIVPLVFGGNVFGWTLDEQQSFSMLDAIVDLGLNAVDTANIYSYWAPGNYGGESETIIGKWLKENPRKRDKLFIFTKVGGETREFPKGLSKRLILRAVEDSLRRLQIDVIDLYQSHWPDPNTPCEETLSAYEQLLKEGKVRAIGASNFDWHQLSNSLTVSREYGLPAYQTLQPEYNLYDRHKFMAGLQKLVLEQNIGVISYFSLASGFLSGKYRNLEDLKQGVRGEKVSEYMNKRGMRILDALDTVSAAHQCSQASVALAWLMAQKAVTAPIASATSVEQLKKLVTALNLHLTKEDLDMLDQAGKI